MVKAEREEQGGGDSIPAPKRQQSWSPSTPPSSNNSFLSASRNNKNVSNNNTNIISVTSFNLQVLHCSLCFQPLTIPVFQCMVSEHTICTSCWVKHEKCPSCFMPSKWKRCRVMEEVLESISVSCQNKTYGCLETFSYSKRVDHEKTCSYMQCSCPFSGCNFTAPSSQIYAHCKQEHTDSVKHFQFDCSFTVSFNTNDKFLVLLEERENVVFLLANRAQHIGNVLTICCFGPPLSEQGYYYDIAANVKGISHRFQSFTKNVKRNSSDDLPLTGFLLDKSCQFGAKGAINLKLCIQSYGSCPQDF